MKRNGPQMLRFIVHERRFHGQKVWPETAQTDWVWQGAQFTGAEWRQPKFGSLWCSGGVKLMFGSSCQCTHPRVDKGSIGLGSGKGGRKTLPPSKHCCRASLLTIYQLPNGFRKRQAALMPCIHPEPGVTGAARPVASDLPWEGVGSVLERCMFQPGWVRPRVYFPHSSRELQGIIQRASDVDKLSGVGGIDFRCYNAGVLVFEEI